MRLAPPILIITLAVIAFAAALRAQSPEVEITAEPHHHLILQDKSIRVFYVDAPPHSETLLHWHRHDYAYVTLGSTDVINAVQGHAPAPGKILDAQTGFVSGNFAHVVRNVGDQPFRNVTVELLDDARLRAAASGDPDRQSANHPDEARGLDILTGGTREILWIKDGVRATEYELQPGGVMPLVASHNMTHDMPGAGPMTHRMPGDTPKDVPRGNILIIPLTDLHLRANMPKNAPRAAWDQIDLDSAYSPSITNGRSVYLIPAEQRVNWINVAPVDPNSTNKENQTARFVTLEFP